MSRTTPKRPPSSRDQLIFFEVRICLRTQADVARQFQVDPSRVSQILKRVEQWRADASPDQVGELWPDQQKRLAHWECRQRMLFMQGLAMQRFLESSQPLVTTKRLGDKPGEWTMERQQRACPQFFKEAVKLNRDLREYADRPQPPAPPPPKPDGPPRRDPYDIEWGMPWVEEGRGGGKYCTYESMFITTWIKWGQFAAEGQMSVDEAAQLTQWETLDMCRTYGVTVPERKRQGSSSSSSLSQGSGFGVQGSGDGGFDASPSSVPCPLSPAARAHDEHERSWPDGAAAPAGAHVASACADPTYGAHEGLAAGGAHDGPGAKMDGTMSAGRCEGARVIGCESEGSATYTPTPSHSHTLTPSHSPTYCMILIPGESGARVSWRARTKYDRIPPPSPPRAARHPNWLLERGVLDELARVFNHPFDHALADYAVENFFLRSEGGMPLTSTRQRDVLRCWHKLMKEREAAADGSR